MCTSVWMKTRSPCLIVQATPMVHCSTMLKHPELSRVEIFESDPLNIGPLGALSLYREVP